MSIQEKLYCGVQVFYMVSIGIFACVWVGKIISEWG